MKSDFRGFALYRYPNPSGPNGQKQNLTLAQRLRLCLKLVGKLHEGRRSIITNEENSFKSEIS